MKTRALASLFILLVLFIYSNGSIDTSADDKPEITSIVTDVK